MVEMPSLRQVHADIVHGILGEAVADGKYPDRFLLRIHSSGKKEQYAHTNHYNLILLHHIQI